MTDFTLNKGGDCRYYDNFLSPELCFYLTKELLNQVNWVTETISSYGKDNISPRVTSSMFDLMCPTPSVKKYWKEDADWVKAGTRGWTPLMGYVKDHIQKSFGVKIWYAQMNHYRTGEDYIGFHSDKEMQESDIVFSISLGNKRRFGFRSKELNSGNFEKELYLSNGSLIMFDYNAGKNNYKHSLPKIRKKDLQDHSHSFGRINITFRTMNEN